jgi:hypothetical protein
MGNVVAIIGGLVILGTLVQFVRGLWKLPVNQNPNQREIHWNGDR